MRLAALILAFLIAAHSAQAETPLVYSKTVLRIYPSDRAASRALTRFTVEVRPLRYLTQQDFYTQRNFVSYEGMLILIDPPSRQTLKPSNLFGRVDVLFVKDSGVISKIAPNITLAELPQPIDSEGPIRAFVLIQAGMAKIADVEPGDRIENELFKKPLAVEEPTTPSPASPSVSAPAAAPAQFSPASPTVIRPK